MRYLICLLLLAGSIAWVGCAPAGLEGTIAASGTVTHNGQAVEGATVVFSPEGEGRAASGLTDASGRFQLQTLTPEDGVMPGKYQVAISKTQVEGGMSEEQADTSKKGEPTDVPVKELLPKKYKSPTTSGLTAEVTAGGKNEFTFDLKD
jgi:hypothetical protein